MSDKAIERATVKMERQRDLGRYRGLVRDDHGPSGAALYGYEPTGDDAVIQSLKMELSAREVG